jgi:hypothetical protein
LFRRFHLPQGCLGVNHLSPATNHLQTNGRLVWISSAPSPRLQPLLCTVFHQGASSIEASAAPTDELVAVERSVIFVDLFRSKDLVVIFFTSRTFV